MHHARLRAAVICRQFDETDQLLLEVCADEDARIRKCRAHVAYGFETLSIMGKPPALAHRAFVIDFPNPFREGLIKKRFPNDNSLFRSLLRFVASFEPNLLRPPIVKRGNWQDREIVPLHGITKFWSCLGQLLHESEEIHAGV